jgi:hypothetical protein
MQIPSQDINLSTDCEMVRARRCIRSIVLTKSKCLQCVTVEGKALTRVCVIDYATNQVVYNQFIKPPSPITDYLTRCVSQLIVMLAPFFSHYNSRLQLLRHNGSSSRICNNDACRTSTSPHAHNAVDDPV